jgi:D-alanyl-D-alanine carboxypeptidase
MLRMRAGAHLGLRGGVFGLVAAVLLLPSEPALAAPYADIVIDGNSGAVLHATNPDARRHPASLTKIMTLYLLFEQLEAGKLKLDTPLKVSQEAAGQAPTKLGLRPGSTLQVEDAIKGMVTRSANDAAVVVAEAIAGDEDEFAKLMTRKARALGMARTVYKNASGLPDDDQVTTARDQSILGRAIQERFPRSYKYFSIRSFTFRGQSIANHNNLLGRVEGVDGIKTGYIGASGFNLVTSVHRGNRYLVAVVMGGSSAGSRDSRMRELINEKIAAASTKRTAPMIAESIEAPTTPESKVAAKIEPKPTPKPESAKPETNAEAKTESRFAVASAISVPMRFTPSAAPAQPAAAPAPQASPAAARPEPSLPAASTRAMPGSTEPIRPVLVKTVSVRAAMHTPSAAPMQVASLVTTERQPTATAAPAALPAPAPSPAAAPPSAAASPTAAAPTVAKPEPLAPQSSASLASAASPASQPQSPSASKPQPAPTSAQPHGAGASPARATAVAPSPTPAAVKKPAPHSGWMIQVGAYPAEREAKQRLSAVKNKAAKILGSADSFTEPIEKGGATYYRARFAGFDKDKAEAACKYLKRNDVECVTIKN